MSTKQEVVDRLFAKAVMEKQVSEARERRNAMRWQAACAAMTGLIAINYDGGERAHKVVEQAVFYADTLLDEFEKGER